MGFAFGVIIPFSFSSGPRLPSSIAIFPLFLVPFLLLKQSVPFISYFPVVIKYYGQKQLKKEGFFGLRFQKNKVLGIFDHTEPQVCICIN